MPKVLIIYHSQTGNTEIMAKAISEGVKFAEATVILKKTADATVDDLLDCDSVAFGTPNNFGYMAGIVKDFFDRTWPAAQDKVANKPYVAFGSSGSGEKSALDSIDRFCNYFKLRKASENIMATGKPSEAILRQCEELGRKFALL